LFPSCSCAAIFAPGESRDREPPNLGPVTCAVKCAIGFG
jgi:hypothetical protein